MKHAPYADPLWIWFLLNTHLIMLVIIPDQDTHNRGIAYGIKGRK